MKNTYLEIPTDLRGSLFFLGSRLISYPNDVARDEWNRTAKDYDLLGGAELVDSESWDQCLDQLRNKLEAAQGLEDWQSEYISVFDTGKDANPLHETEYGKARAMTKGAQLADIAGFYKAFGFGLDESKDFREMLDHLAVELEFYGLLLLKEYHLRGLEDSVGTDLVLDAQRKFLRDHLGTFVDALKLRPGIVESEFFTPIVRWISSLVDSECRKLNVDAKKIYYATDEKEPETMCCASKLGGAKPCA